MLPLDWRCHICNDIRPDDKISVNSHELDLGSGVVVTENIRYCNDRPACIEAAKTFTFFPKQKDDKQGDL